MKVRNALLLTKYRYNYDKVPIEHGEFSLSKTAGLIDKFFSRFRSNTLGAIPHIGIGILASELAGLGIDVNVSDLYEKDALINVNDFDLIGISFMDISFDYVMDALQGVDTKKVILGGIGARVLESRIRDTFPDISIVKGEAEGLMEDIVRDIEKDNLQPSYKRNLSVDLSALTGSEPWLSGKTAMRNFSFVRDSWLQTIEIGRGCQYHCPFCISGTDTNITYKPVDIVEKELDDIRKTAGNILFFIDQNLCAYPEEYLIDLFSVVNKKNMLWVGEGTINDIIDNDCLISEMAQNCFGFLVGVEDMTHTVRGASSKNRLKESFPDKVAYLRKKSFPINYSIIFGTDDQYYPDDFIQTAEQVNTLGITVLAHMATPRIGTVWNKKLEEEERIIDWNYGHRDHRFHIVHKPRHMEPEEAMAGFTWFHQNVFSLQKVLKRTHNNLVECGTRYATGLGALEYDGFMGSHLLTHQNKHILQRYRF